MSILRSAIAVAVVLIAVETGSEARAGAPRRPGGAESVYLQDVRFALDEIEKRCGHFFPVKKIDWKAVRKEFLEKAAKVKSDQEHLVLLVKLLARLRDGHASLRPLEKGKAVKWPDDGSRDFTGPGMFLCRSGGKVLVKSSWGPAQAAGVLPGMEVVKVNGGPVAKWLAAKVAELSETRSFSTDHQAYSYACHWGLAAKPGTKLRLELRGVDGKKVERTLTYSRASVVPEGPAVLPSGLKGSSDLQYGTTPDGYGYIHVRRCPGNLPELTDGALAALGDVPGMILDFRGNSGGGMDHDAFLGRFVPQGRSIRFAKGYASAGPSPYGGPVVVIVDATVRSTGETASGIFKEDGRGYMIGECPTAGMSSGKATIDLPSRLFSLYVSVSSNKGRFNGGRGIEGIGVIPHETVELEAADLAKGVDTLIRRAEGILKDFPKGKVPYDPAAFGWKKDGAGKSQS